MSVTAYGREMIEKTKQVRCDRLIQKSLPKLTYVLCPFCLEQEVQDRYNTANGYEYDASIIYGDTDSVMVRFGCPDLETAMKLGSFRRRPYLSEYTSLIRTC